MVYSYTRKKSLTSTKNMSSYSLPFLLGASAMRQNKAVDLTARGESELLHFAVKARQLSGVVEWSRSICIRRSNERSSGSRPLRDRSC
jgi:hypothetical protein